MNSERRFRGRTIVVGLLALVACIAALVAWRLHLGGTDEIPLEGTGGSGGAGDAASEQLVLYRELCRGKELAGEGKYAEALPVFEKLAAQEINSSYKWDAEVQAASAMARLGRHADALARLDRVINDCPLKDEIPNAQLAKAEACSLAGRHDDAIGLLDHMVMTYTDVWPRICEESLKQMAAVYNARGEPGMVRATLARLIMDYPGAENTERDWAEKQTRRLTEARQKAQEGGLAELVAAKRFKKLDSLGPGTTTLAAADGPYLIVTPFQVSHDQVLRIEGDSEVRFGVVGRLRIEGRLEVLGTPDKPVSLLPLTDDPTKDWWQGVEIAQEGPAATACRLSHCRVLGAEMGLRVRGGGADLDHCVFDRCGRVSVLAGRGSRLALSGCQIVDGYRIGVEGESSSHVQLNECRIAGMTTHGVLLQEAAEGSRIGRNRIEDCGRTGLLVRGKCEPAIDGCEIRRAAEEGIDAIEGASPIVTSALVESNGGIGIRFRERSQTAVQGSRILRNGKAGIVADLRSKGKLVGNLIEGNGDGGLQLRLGSETRIEANRLVGNKGVGLLIQNAQPATLSGNDLSGNTEAGLRNEGPGEVQAAGNWWGFADEAEILKLIQDRQDKAEWGPVQFRPWLTAPPQLSQSAPAR